LWLHAPTPPLSWEHAHLGTLPPLPLPLNSWLDEPTPPLSSEHAHHGAPPLPPLPPLLLLQGVPTPPLS